MATVLRMVAIVASSIVALGFLVFAMGEADRGSKGQQQKLAEEIAGEPAPDPALERARERRHGSAREMLDDANDFLLSPFAEVVRSDNEWVKRGVPTLLALLVYGVGLLLLANFLPKPRASGGDWRAGHA